MISVVVPVYNVECYLEKCIQSILAQTYEDFELFLIDDGSTDASSVICDKLAREDHRIHVIHQKNQGVSFARNNGLECATRKYVTFIDPDDYIDRNYFFNMLSSIERENTDVVVSDVVLVNEDGRVVNSYIPDLTNETLSEELLITSLYERELIPTVWGKLFKRSIWKNVRFPVGYVLFEDVWTLYRVLCGAGRISICHEARYYFCLRQGSAERSAFNSGKTKALDLCEDMMEDARQKRSCELYQAIIAKFTSLSFHLLLKLKKREHEEIYDRCLSNIKQYRWGVFCNSRAKLKVRVACLLSYGSIYIVKHIFSLRSRMFD